MTSTCSMPFQSPSEPRYVRCTTRPPPASPDSFASSGVTQKLTFTAAGSAWTLMPAFVGDESYL